MRPITFEINFIKYPEGSCLVKMGDTLVLCNASIEEKVPPFLDGKGKGWITAEYSMLPRSTNIRTRREASAGKLSGRTQEIQRLIGRSIRACINLKALGERTITLDCDVLQADGGTRCASINGAFVAMTLAVQKLQKKGTLASSPIKSAIAAISVGIKKGEILVDLDYKMDSTCDVDMNIVQLEGGKLVELQGTAEGDTFSLDESTRMIQKATMAIEEIIALQKEVLGTA